MKKVIETTVCDWCGQEKTSYEQMHKVYFEKTEVSSHDMSVHEPIDIHEGCKKEAIISAVLHKQACKI